MDEELEAKLYAPDLEEQEDGSFELDVEHYPLPDGSDIEDEYLRKVWDGARKLIEEGEEAEGDDWPEKDYPDIKDEEVLVGRSKAGKPVSRMPHEWWAGLSPSDRREALESVTPGGYLGTEQEQAIGRALGAMNRYQSDLVKEAHKEYLDRYVHGR